MLIPVIGPISCWASLFQNAVIASGFPIPSRTDGKGLEISFPDMVSLSKSHAFVKVGEGLVLDGLVTLLYPIKSLPRDGAIQWHLEIKQSESTRDERDERDEFIHPAQVMETHALQDWYQELDPKKISDSRIFLGWTEEAQTVLGTCKCFPMAVTVSGAFDCKPTRCVATYGGAMSLKIPGIVTFAANTSWTRSAVATGVSGIESKDDDAVMHLLSNAIKHQTIVWGDDKDTGWLIPGTTIFLYMLQISVLRRSPCMKVLPPELLSSLAEDAGHAAFETLS